MLFWLELNQEKDYGQIPVIAENGQVKYFIQGNLDNPNHTLYLNDINKKKLADFSPMVPALLLLSLLMW